MPLSALLLSEDEEVVDILRPILPELGIRTDQCRSARTARSLLHRQKYEAVVVDADTIGSLGFLTSLRQLPMTRNAVVFALTHSASVNVAFQSGANFVLEKPLSPESAQKSFRAAQGMILRERRRYYRHPVEMLATLEYGKMIEPVDVHNLSEGGMAISADPSLAAGTSLKWKFDLPETRCTLSGEGQVTWSSAGKAGISFSFVPRVFKERLEAWLAAQSQQEEIAAPIFADAKTWNRED